MGSLGAFIVLFGLLVEINCGKAQSPTKAVGCTPLMDIAILADISLSMKDEHRGALKNVVHRLVDEVGVSETTNHFGFVTFAINGTVHSKFSDPSYYNASNLKSKVEDEVKIIPRADATRIDLAMNEVLTQLFSSDGGDRPNTRNVLLIFTDGNPVFINDTWDKRDKIPLLDFPEKLKKKNIDAWAIGVGPGASNHKKDMEKIVGDKSLVIVYDNFDDLEEKFINKFKKKFCVSQWCPKDVAFILDSSGSIKDEDFNEEKEIVKKLMVDLDIGPNNDRVALVQFGTKSKLEAEFGQYQALKFQDVLQKLPKMNDRTRIDEALKVAVDKIFPNAREGVYKIAIILTDGVQSTGAQGLRPSSKPLRDAGVRVIAVGIGVGKRERRLRLMTDRDEDVVDTKNIQRLLQKILIDLGQSDCNPPPSPARNPGPVECTDEPGFKRECRKKAKDKVFCWDNLDFCYINCRKSCELCHLL